MSADMSEATAAGVAGGGKRNETSFTSNCRCPPGGWLAGRPCTDMPQHAASSRHTNALVEAFISISCMRKSRVRGEISICVRNLRRFAGHATSDAQLLKWTDMAP
jgi:hypothetical protein